LTFFRAKFLIPGALMLLLLFAATVADAYPIRVNGGRIPGETLRYKRGDYIPLRALAERLGFEYRRTGDQLVIVFADGARQPVPLDSTKAKVNGIEIDFTRKVHIDRGAEYVSPEFVSKVLGATVVSTGGEIQVFNRLSSAKVAIVEGRESLILSGSSRLRYKTLYLENPHRLVIDFTGFELKMDELLVAPSSANYRTMRFAQFQRKPDTARVVIEFHKQTEIPKRDFALSANGRTLTVRLGTPGEGFVTPIEVAHRDVNGSTLIEFKNIDCVDMIEEWLTGPRRVLVDVYGSDIGVQSEEIKLNNKWIEKVRVAQFSTDPMITRLVLDLKTPVEFHKEYDEPARTVRLKVSKAPLTGKKFVVDPGHGGNDRGTHGYLGGREYQEKKYCLLIALELKKYLEEAGATVYITKTKETQKPAYRTRADVANRNRADAFLSVHLNAIRDKSINGIEVIYWGTTSRHSTRSKKLASSILKHASRVSGMSAFRYRSADRLAVLNLTRGPAVIIECGFMTNSNDLSKIITEDFRQRVAFGICEGVKEYCISGYKPVDFERNEVSREELEKIVRERAIKRPNGNGNGNGNGHAEQNGGVDVEFEGDGEIEFEEE